MRPVFILPCIAIALWSISYSCADATYEQGERIYVQHCSNCHGQQGEGIANLYPSISDSEDLISDHRYLVCLISNGSSIQSDANEAFVAQMPANPDLSDVALANLINYMQQKWVSGVTSEYITPKDISVYKSNCEID